MSRKLSLQYRILVLVVSVTVIMMSVIVWFDSYNLQQSVQETYISQLNGMTTAINGRYEESHKIEDVQQIFDYIQYKNTDVLELTLYGADKVLASTNRSRIGQPSPPGLISALLSGNTIAEKFRGANGIPQSRLTAPLKEDSVTVGAIELLLDSSEKEALIRQRTLFIIVAGFAITVLLLVILHFIIRNLLLRPLMQIREAALSVKEGMACKPIALAASPEINVVAEAFNEMVQNQEARYEELQQALQTVQQAQKQLVESEKMSALGGLVAGVSHEINTPLGIGVTAASFLAEKAQAFETAYRSNAMKRSELEEFLRTVQETAGMIQSNLSRASELVKSFKQVAVDRSVEMKRTFQVKEYIREILVSLQPQLKKTKHRVELLGPDGLEIYSDPGALSQIITNLIMNSLIHAYDPDAEGRMTIEIREERDGRLTIQYADDGRGMPPDVLAQMFNPFFTTNRGGGGTGLGMHIVYNLVTQSLGGTIRCESKIGAGTVFTLQFPMNER